MRTLQLLPRQVNVVDVRLADDGVGTQAVQALLVSLACARHLTAFSVQRPLMSGGPGTPLSVAAADGVTDKLAAAPLHGCRLSEQCLPHAAALLPLLL